MAVTEAELGQLLIAVAVLEQKQMLMPEEATTVRGRITELSGKIAKKSRGVLAPHRRRHGRQTFTEGLKDDAPIFTVLKKETLDLLSNKKGKLLLFLFNNKDSFVIISRA